MVDASAPARSSGPPELARDVLIRCKALDPIAFRAFVVRYQRPVFAVLSRMLGRGPHVEDLAQEAFLRAFRAFPAFDVDAPAKPSTWILTIATRLALDSRKRRVLAILPIEAAETESSETTPHTEHARSELRTSIAHATAQLPDDQRAVFVLAEFHGLTMAEIAEALDVAEATVKTRLHRARTKLQQRLTAHREEP
ncbi:MAG: polymerase subfamily sigma factor [Deltaproteobacteria bacterium]|nr:polymerase subfamily sigma factor [Deltaproteobacteria bacterium]